MRRGRLIYWFISAAIILSGAGWILWLRSPTNQSFEPAPVEANKLVADIRARDDQPPEPWTPDDAWWKQITIDAYDKGMKGQAWPAARRAVVAFAAGLAGGSVRTGDEPVDAAAAASVAVEYQCDEPLVLYIAAQDNPDAKQPRNPWVVARKRRAAVDALRTQTRYAPFLRCLALYDASATADQGSTGNNSSVTARGYLDAATALLPEVAADKSMPQWASLVLLNKMELVCRAMKLDRAQLVNPLIAAMEQAGQPSAVVETLRGDFLISYAWDARGDSFAGGVKEDGWKGFKARLADARTALTAAFEADKTNGYAAARMITVCMGEGAERPEMERWFKRAMEADPGNFNACSRKMLFLEPKWGGSVPAMILFGRELTRTATHPRATRVPLTLVDAHWSLAEYSGGPGGPSPGYFADNPDVWDDVSRVYETYLKQVPNARQHRTRYAVIAGWAKKWEVANSQFELLGDQYSKDVVSDSVIKTLRDQAKSQAGGKASK